MPRIRPYRASDWDAFVTLDVETGLHTLRYATEKERQAFQARWPEELKARFGWGPEGPTLDEARLHVLEDDDGDYAGHLWVSFRDDPLTGLPRLWVNTMAIVPKHRSRGWGRLLVDHAEDEARHRGACSLGLAVDADNVVARKLYEEMGFQTVRLRMIKPLPGKTERPPKS
ncbi:MAG: GNAT family N-acetyltransferase [Deltaproteobacteria bacterium]|jgi:ribosomal protein S18 acetylase RimI-like enzyme|nr:GNAT family N-acetyltransferase [Deltaproteobacteria bacterium]